MRLFTELTGISSSYIHEVEKGRVLPGLERLGLLATVFVGVAAEQGAADPNDDARLLYRAREREVMEEELNFDPSFAGSICTLRNEPVLADLVCELTTLPEEQIAVIAEPLREAVALFRTLHPQVQSGLARRLAEIIAIINELEAGQMVGQSKHPDVPLEIAEALHAALEKLRTDVKASAVEGDAGFAARPGDAMPPVPTPS